MKAKKCHLATDEVIWLGHKICRAGVTSDENPTSAVWQWKTLQDIKEVQTFLGVCGWWRKFVPDYAMIAYPLYKLLEKDRFERTEEAETAFQTLKQCLVTPPILCHAGTYEQLVVTTNASDVEVGGALLQEHPSDSIHPVAYFSRVLTKREKLLYLR